MLETTGQIHFSDRLRSERNITKTYLTLNNCRLHYIKPE